MLTERKKKILKTVVEEYIKRAKPVSSKTIVRKEFPKLSSATIRNEMLDLTRKGFLIQPYTSAGKIPTIRGFNFFLKNFLKETEPLPLEKRIFRHLKEKYLEKRQMIKEIAKKMAEIAEEAVIVAFSKNDFFYTGLSHLFRQPEFKDFFLIYKISEIIDHLDKTMGKIFDKIEKMEILIGKENPFGDKSTVILDEIKLDNQKVVIGILGPVRMDYNKNVGLIKFIKKLIYEQN
jgi:heat-inducible transcriptional repressor